MTWAWGKPFRDPLEATAESVRGLLLRSIEQPRLPRPLFGSLLSGALWESYDLQARVQEMVAEQAPEIAERYWIRASGQVHDEVQITLAEKDAITRLGQLASD